MPSNLRMSAATEAALQAASTGTKKTKWQAPQLRLALHLKLEDWVGDETKPLVRIGFACSRLLRRWTSLRWDDSQGLNPGSSKKLARGLTAQLARTKTFGHNKKMGVLPIFISEEAYLARKWLYAGWELWSQTALAATKRRALYADFGLRLWAQTAKRCSPTLQAATGQSTRTELALTAGQRPSG